MITWIKARNTRLISNLMVYFWSHGKDDGHIIRSVIAETSMLCENFTTLLQCESKKYPPKNIFCDIFTCGDPV